MTQDVGPRATGSSAYVTEIRTQNLRNWRRNGPAARRLVLILEYDGSNYAGFQLQAGQPTIQGEIEKSLAKFTRESIRIRGASRTDSGAHAKGQVVDFATRQPSTR